MQLKFRFCDIGKEKIAEGLFIDLLHLFKDNKELFECVYDFLWNRIPHEIISILEKNSVLPIKDVNNNTLYEFKIRSFRKYYKNFFSSYSELIKSLDLESLIKLLKDSRVELIGIDESKLETLLQGSTVTYLKSVAFRMFKQNNLKKEIIGPLIHSFMLSFESEEKSDKKTQFITYLWNLFIIYISAKNSILYGYKPIIFLHGPLLVRALGGFTDLHFSYEELKNIFDIEKLLSEERILPEILKEISADNLIRELHQQEKKLFDNGRNREAVKVLMKRRDFNIWKQSIPFNMKIDNGGTEDVEVSITSHKNYKRRNYSAISIYMFFLQKVYKLIKEKEIILVSVVEDISKSREFSAYLFPNLFFENGNQYRDWLPNCIKELIGYRKSASPSSLEFRREVYKEAYKIMKKYLQVRDIILFTQLLNEGDYTSPIPIMRYLPRKIYDNYWGITELGIDNDLAIFVEYFFPYPKYKVVASYLRTTPHREPIRLEFFDVYPDYSEIVGLTYFLSLFYPNYGLPIILKYVDQIARTPKKLIEAVVANEVKLALQNLDFDLDVVLKVLNLLSRNFFRR